MWAVVNGQEIHRAEAEKYYSNRLNDQSQAQPGTAQAAAASQEEAMSLMLNIVDELINNDILLERAKNWAWRPPTARSKTNSPSSKALTPRTNSSGS